jgi:hypothetical protein
MKIDILFKDGSTLKGTFEGRIELKGNAAPAGFQAYSFPAKDFAEPRHAVKFIE